MQNKSFGIECKEKDDNRFQNKKQNVSDITVHEETVERVSRSKDLASQELFLNLFLS